MHRRMPAGLLRLRGDRGSGSTLGGAALIAIASTIAALLIAVDVPQRIDCLVRPVTELATTAPSPRTTPGSEDCPSGPAAGRATAQAAEPAAQQTTGLTARPYSTTWVPAYQDCSTTWPLTCVRGDEIHGCENDGVGPVPGCPDPRQVPLDRFELCALGPPAPGDPGIDAGTGAGMLCLLDVRDRDEPVIVRCLPDRDGYYPAATAAGCALTDAEPTASLDTSVEADLVDWCIPLAATPTLVEGQPGVRIEWACADRTGAVHACHSLVRDDDPAGPADVADLTALAAENHHRAQTCDSRTFGADLIVCGEPGMTGRAGCTLGTLPGGAPSPDIDCVLFPADPRTEATSNVYGKPMHCATTPPPALDCPPADAAEEPLGAGGRGLTATRRRVVDLCRDAAADPAGVSIVTGSFVRGTDYRLVDVEGVTVVPAEGDATQTGRNLNAAAQAAKQVQALQQYVGGLTAPPQGQPVPAVPTIVLGYHPTQTLGQRKGDPGAIAVGIEQADSLFVIAHEMGHYLAWQQGMPSRTTPVYQDSDWQMASVHEGLSDAFAWLVVSQNGASAVFPSRRGPQTRGRDANISFRHLDPAAGPHHNGALVLNVVQNLQESLMVAGTGTGSGAGSSTSATAVNLQLGQLLLNAAAHPNAGQGFAGFQHALLEEADALGIPPHLVHAAFAAQGWPIPGTGTCPVTAPAPSGLPEAGDGAGPSGSSHFGDVGPGAGSGAALVSGGC